MIDSMNNLPKFILDEPFLVECARAAAPLKLDFNKKATIEELDMLADNYCEAMEKLNKFNSMPKDEIDQVEYQKAIQQREMNFGALVIRNWKSMKNLYERVHHTYGGSDFSRDDLPSTFTERLNKACKYKRWQFDPETDTREVKLNKAGEVDKRFSTSNKKVNSQQCINMSINTHFYELTGGKMLYDNKKANLLQTSMDTVIGTDKDGNNKTIEDTLADNTACPTALGEGITVNMVVESYFKANQPDVAIIIDAFMNLTDEGRDKLAENDFSKVRSFIKHIDENLIREYIRTYSVNSEMIYNTVRTLQKYNKIQLDTYIGKIREKLQSDFR